MRAFLSSILKPSEYVDQLTNINLDGLRNQGIKLLLFDLDNTLVPSDENWPSVTIVNWFHDLKQKGFKLAIISNSLRRQRLQALAEYFGVDAYYFVCKPWPAFLKKIIIHDFKYQQQEVAIIGDQIMTDVLGGNILNAYTILIKNCPSGYFNDGREDNLLKNTHSGIVEKFINK